MTDEIELKFIEIDKDFIFAKIEKTGAIKKYDKIFKATAFNGLDFSTKDSNKKYLRVRDEGDVVCLTYKSPAKDDKLHIREEIEVEVKEFQKTIEILSKVGLEAGPIITKRRIHYEIETFENMGKVSFEIEEYSKIPIFLEIEVSNIEQMSKICKLLGLNISKGRREMITEIYPELLDD